MDASDSISERIGRLSCDLNKKQAEIEKICEVEEGNNELYQLLTEFTARLFRVFIHIVDEEKQKKNWINEIGSRIKIQIEILKKINLEEESLHREVQKTMDDFLEETTSAIHPLPINIEFKENIALLLHEFAGLTFSYLLHTEEADLLADLAEEERLDPSPVVEDIKVTDPNQTFLWDM